MRKNLLMVLKLAPLLTLLAACSMASSTKTIRGVGGTREVGWVKLWNNALIHRNKVEAAEMVPENDYIRYREQVVKRTVNKNVGSTPPTALEKEMVYYKVALGYLYKHQEYRSIERYRESSPNSYPGADTVKGKREALEQANIWARKLMELPNLHKMSIYLIARIQELQGIGHNLPVPHNAWRWIFGTRGVLLNDFRKDYKRILDMKTGGFPGQAASITCYVLFICRNGVSFDDELVVEDLKRAIWLRFYDRNNDEIPLEDP